MRYYHDFISSEVPDYSVAVIQFSIAILPADLFTTSYITRPLPSPSVKDDTIAGRRSGECLRQMLAGLMDAAPENDDWITYNLAPWHSQSEFKLLQISSSVHLNNRPPSLLIACSSPVAGERIALSAPSIQGTGIS